MIINAFVDSIEIKKFILKRHIIKRLVDLAKMAVQYL